MELKFMTLAEWTEKYKPVKNPNDPNTPFDGCMLETGGVDRKTMIEAFNQNKRCVWTLCNTDGFDFIQDGYHYVNALAFFVTEVPFEGGGWLQVNIEHEEGDEMPREWGFDVIGGDSFDGYDDAEDAREGIERLKKQNGWNEDDFSEPYPIYTD